MDLTRRQLIGSSVAAGVGLALASRGRAAAQADADSPAAPLRVQVAVFDGFELTDGLAPYDVLCRASGLGGAMEITLVSVNGAAEVLALDDVSLKPNAAFDPGADVLVVPGGPQLWRAGETPPGLVDAFMAFRQPGKLLATVCTGAVFAARAGLLNGRNATTHRLAQEAIVQEGALLQQGRVVDDGDLITSGGVTSGIDLALYLIERYCGSQLSIQVEQLIMYERRGVVWKA